MPERTLNTALEPAQRFGSSAGELRDCFNSLKLFAKLASDSRELLLAASALRQCAAGSLIVAAGTRPKFLYVVVAGAAEIYAGEEDRKAIIGTAERKASFFAMDIINKALHPLSARAIEDTTLLVIEANAFRRVFSRDPEFARKIALKMTRKLGAMMRQHIDLKLRTHVQRVANYLLRLHETREDDEEEDVLSLPYDRELMAALLGMTPESFAEALAALEGWGYNRQGDRLWLDLQSLRGIADPQFNVVKA